MTSEASVTVTDIGSIRRHPEKVTVTILAEDSGYMISYHAQPVASERLVITFDTANGHKSKTGFGVQFLTKNGYDVIHVAQSAWSSYQLLSQEAFKSVVEAYLDGRPVFTYGSSLGAYAAIYFAGAIDARALALSPRCPADPFIAARVPEYSDYGHLFQHRDFRDPAIQVSKQPPIIAYDPLDQVDNSYVEERIRIAYPEAELIRLEHGQHSVALSLKASGVLKLLVFTVVNENRAPDIRIDPLNDVRYLTTVALETFRQGDYALCNQHLRATLARGGHFRCLDIIKKLLQTRTLEVYPGDLVISEDDREKILVRYRPRLTGLADAEHYKTLCDAYVHVMAYEAACETALMATKLFPDSELLAKTLIKAQGNLKFIRNLKRAELLKAGRPKAIPRLARSA